MVAPCDIFVETRPKERLSALAALRLQPVARHPPMRTKAERETTRHLKHERNRAEQSTPATQNPQGMHPSHKPRGANCTSVPPQQELKTPTPYNLATLLRTRVVATAPLEEAMRTHKQGTQSGS